MNRGSRSSTIPTSSSWCSSPKGYDWYRTCAISTQPTSLSGCRSRCSTRLSITTLCCTSSGPLPNDRVISMDFTFTEEQETISKLARELFERRASPERLTELEAGESRYDAALWKELAAVDLLGTAPIVRHGSPEQRRRFLPGVIDATRILTAGLQEPGRSDPTNPATTARRDGPNWRLDGTKELVPAAQLADTVLIPASIDGGTDGAVGLFLLATDARGVDIRPVATTTREPHA